MTLSTTGTAEVIDDTHAGTVVAFAAAGDTARLDSLLDALGTGELRSLVATLAYRVVCDRLEREPATREAATTPAVGPAGAVSPCAAQLAAMGRALTGSYLSSPTAVCELAIAAAATSFDTTPDRILSPCRRQTVADARAVAMTAARAHGLSLPEIADRFDRDHSSVLHAVRRTRQRPRLAAAAQAITEEITNRYRPVAGELIPPDPSVTWQAAATRPAGPVAATTTSNPKPSPRSHGAFLPPPLSRG